MVPRGFQIGRIFGTDIYLSPTFLLIFAFWFITGGREGASGTAVFAMVLLVSVLLHEFGHAIAVRRLLKTEPTILIWAFGGYCQYRDEFNRRTPQRDLIISLCGPAVTAILAAILIPLALTKAGAGNPAVWQFVKIMAWANGIWLLANLLPIVPLDGGCALRAILQMNMQRHRADVWAARISVVFAAGALALGLHLGMIMISVFAGLFLFQNLAPARGQI
jgi:Zn-dependent protease